MRRYYFIIEMPDHTYDDAEGLVAASLIAVRVTVDHLELHVRGVTAEPWGRGRTVLERDADGTWRLLPVH